MTDVNKITPSAAGKITNLSEGAKADNADKIQQKTDNKSIFAAVKGNVNMDNLVSQKEIMSLLNIDQSDNNLMQVLKSDISSVDLSGLKTMNDVKTINTKIEQQLQKINYKVQSYKNEVVSKLKGDVKNETNGLKDINPETPQKAESQKLL